ncbi:MAG: RNA polymerase sigma factor [Bacillota bacterium]|jgi:RNA polymerase sigma-70 factor (ECF subfamily)
MDRETFAKLAREAEATYYRVALSILRQEQDAEDAVQNGLIKAYQKRNQLKDIACFRTWSTRIVIHECYRLRRREQKTVPLDEALNAAAPPSGDPELYEAIRSLPPKIRITVVLYYVEGYSVAEVASILRIPQGTVKSRLSKGRGLMRTALKEDSEHEKRSLAKSLS